MWIRKWSLIRKCNECHLLVVRSTVNKDLKCLSLVFLRSRICPSKSRSELSNVRVSHALPRSLPEYLHVHCTSRAIFDCYTSLTSAIFGCLSLPPRLCFVFILRRSSAIEKGIQIFGKTWDFVPTRGGV